jgi:hypothetical protein
VATIPLAIRSFWKRVSARRGRIGIKIRVFLSLSSFVCEI